MALVRVFVSLLAIVYVDKKFATTVQQQALNSQQIG
jgi:hypothetical protein